MSGLEVAMRLGYVSMNTPSDVRPDRLARALEDRGYDSLFVGEHSHIPTSRLTPYPAGGELPDSYLHMMDPFVSLTLAASATTTLTIGTGVALPLERDLLALAKTVATLDVLSSGRLEFGVGVGWNAEELANHRPDISWSMRYRALEECVEALRRLWIDTQSEHHGKYFDFDSSWSFPKPHQTPHPPVLLGTAGRLGSQHAARWADGWMPTDVGLGPIDGGMLDKKVRLFHEAAEQANRPHLPITMVAFGDPTAATLDHYRDLGIDRVVLGTARANWDDPSTTMTFIDHYADLIPELA